MEPQKHLVLDLSTVKFRRLDDNRRLMARTPVGEVLAVIDTVARGSVDSEEWREAAFQVLDAAAASGRLVRCGEQMPVAFYHPQLRQVSVGPAPSRVFQTDRPLRIDAQGTIGVLTADTFRIGRVVLPERSEVSVATMSRHLLQQRQ